MACAHLHHMGTLSLVVIVDYGKPGTYLSLIQPLLVRRFISRTKVMLHIQKFTLWVNQRQNEHILQRMTRIANNNSAHDGMDTRSIRVPKHTPWATLNNCTCNTNHGRNFAKLSIDCAENMDLENPKPIPWSSLDTTAARRWWKIHFIAYYLDNRLVVKCCKGSSKWCGLQYDRLLRWLRNVWLGPPVPGWFVSFIMWLQRTQGRWV